MSVPSRAPQSVSSSSQESQRVQLLESLKAEFFQPKVVENRYTVQHVIGEGSYGVVCSAFDENSRVLVAVKRITHVFDDIPEAVRTLRELKFLRMLKHHENIITVRDVLLPSDARRFNDVFVVLELMPTDLTRVLRSKINLSNDHIRWLAYQLLRGVHYIHSANVFHRDLKPSNILINAACDLRICDFGLARAASLSSHEKDLVFWTDYVATRWYRAPELIMTAYTNYTTAIDIWSVGCIIGEMLNKGRPLFPGMNSTDQLEKIVNVCGTPTESALESVRNVKAKEFLCAMPKRPRKSFSTILPMSCDPQAISLLECVLDFDPKKRPSAAEALAHPYFASLHDPDMIEMDCDPVPLEEFEFERQNLSIEGIRKLFLEEILKYHPDKRSLYINPGCAANCGSLHFDPSNQATKFSNAMRANESGYEPAPAWASLPNQQLHGLIAEVVEVYDKDDVRKQNSVAQARFGGVYKEPGDRGKDFSATAQRDCVERVDAQYYEKQSGHGDVAVMDEGSGSRMGVSQPSIENEEGGGDLHVYEGMASRESQSSPTIAKDKSNFADTQISVVEAHGRVSETASFMETERGMDQV